MDASATIRSRRALGTLAALSVILAAAPAFSGGVAIIDTVLSDNGDDDGFGDSRETVGLTLTVQNTTETALADVTLHVVSRDPLLACSATTVPVGDLAPGEILETAPFTVAIGDVDRTGSGLGPHDALAAAFDITVSSTPGGQSAHPSRLVLDLDLDVSGGAGPTVFEESFEETLGAFEIDNMDQSLHGLTAADGYRCQYQDPDWVNSNNASHPDIQEQCFPGQSQAHADAVFWGLSGPSFSPLGGRGFSGFHSLFFGVDLGPPQGWTTPYAVLEAAVTSDPIALGWDDVSPALSFKHQVSLVSELLPAWIDTAIARGVVMVQFADDNGDPVGDWIKVDPHHNPYEVPVANDVVQCFFDPIDDGSTEDDFFDPTDPEREYGPSSTCFPERVFAEVGETSSDFDPANVGVADGPGLDGFWGIGTWIEAVVDLSRFRGRKIRVRFLATDYKASNGAELWEDTYGWNPIEVDDGWWIDDVTIDGALTTPADVDVDDKDNSGLPLLPDADADLVADLCDNCTDDPNPDQADQDADGVGDACDPCPSHPFTEDFDLDGFCAEEDNCPFDPNPDQVDVDEDGAGLPCDCDDSDPATYPGAAEVNDGKDNQCPGDAGYGVIDETSGNSGFLDPGDKTRYSWPAQAGAQRYQVARSDFRDFIPCATLGLPTFNTFIIDTDVPAAGSVFYYLNRPFFPFLGSWGQDSEPQERTLPCGN